MSISSENIDLIEKTHGCLVRAERQAIRTFTAFHNRAPHQQLECVVLKSMREDFREVMVASRKESPDMQEIEMNLRIIKTFVFDEISRVIHALNMCAARNEDGLDTMTISSLKHDTESTLIVFVRFLQEVFAAFGIRSLEQEESDPETSKNLIA